MPEFDRLAFTLGQLDRQMNFFSRAETKAAWIFAIDAGLLSILALNYPYRHAGSVLGVAGGLSFLLALVSTSMIVRVFIPHLRSAKTHSVLYFKDIAAMSCEGYSARLGAISPDDLMVDARAQIWRNAEILKVKYRYVHLATVSTMFAMLPWLAFLLVTGFTGGKIDLG